MAALRVLALAGSYRTGSYNQAMIAGLRRVAPKEIEVVDFDLRTVPHYDGDLEAAGDPETVVALKEAVRGADAIIIATPEYNGGIPGVLKNGIDWASRMYPNAPIRDKVVGIMGATPGRSGTRLAQEQLRRVLGRTGAVVVNEPEIEVARAGWVIEGAEVVSDELNERLRDLLAAVVEAVDNCQVVGSASVVA
jgi:chromate reductase